MRSLSASTLSVPLHCTCIETIKVFQNWFGTIVQWLLLTARTSAMGREGTFQSWPLGMTPTHLGICSGNWHTNFSTMGWNIFWKARRIEKIIHLGSGYFSSLDSTKSSVLSYAHKETHTFPFNYVLSIPQRVLVFVRQLVEILYIIMNKKFWQQSGSNHHPWDRNSTS